MKITTKTGDKGQTGLFAGPRVSKSSELIELMGQIDELQSLIGLAKFVDGVEKYGEILEKIQADLYRLMSIVGFRGEAPEGIGNITAIDVEGLEQVMEGFKEEVGDLSKFVLPGQNERGARLHVARAVCRRVERRFVGSSIEHEWGLKYLNRLSDLLFVLAYTEEK